MVNGLQLLDTWQNYFGSPEGARLGLLVSGTRLGQIASIPFVSPLIQRLGRRWPILIGSVIILVGVAIQASAQSFAMFTVGRVIAGFGNNIQECTCPLLISELTHPYQRPQMTALMNTTGSVGMIMAAWITYGTASLQPSPWSWRLPTLLQVVSSLFQSTMVFFMPESPRFLIASDREEEARRILTKYHAEGEEDADIVRFELAQIKETLEAEKSVRSPWRAWIETPANRHRLLITVTLGFGIQWCGNAIISYYLKLLLEGIGITNSTTQLIINGSIQISSFCFAILWALSIDHIGRRKLFLTGMVGMFCALLILTSCTGVNAPDFPVRGLANTSVAMIFIFGAFYKMCGTTQDAYFSEIAPYGLRDKTFIIKQTCDAFANLFSGFVNPIGLDAIGWRYYIVWLCVLVSNFTIIFFFYPEVRVLFIF